MKRKYRVFDLVAVALLAIALSVWLPRLEAQTGFFQKISLLVSGAPACTISAGSGSPEGAVTGNVCDFYLRTNGSTGAVAYVKASGSGNTGWEAPGGTGATPNAAAAPSAVIRKTADESVTSSTALQSDDQLLVAIAASETWVLNWTLSVDGATAGDIKLALNVPASATGVWAVFGLQSGATTTTDTITTTGSTDLTDTGAVTIGTAGSGTPTLVRVQALVVNSTNAGSITLRWAQGSSSVTATKVLTNSSLEAVNLSQTTTTTAAHASRAAALYPGRLFFPTDAYQVQRDTGAAYAGWGPTFAFTTPSDTGFAWVNQGTSTIATTKDALVLTTPADGAGGNLRVRVKTAPATPYTITAFFLSTAGMKSFQSYGLLFRESGTGKIHYCDVLGITDGTFHPQSTKWTNPTTFSADYVNINGLPFGWMRIQDDGANRTCAFSADGQNWNQIHSVTRLDFLTGGADQVGFAASSENSATPNQPVILTLLSWKVT